MSAVQEQLQRGRPVVLDELGSIPATLNTSNKENRQDYDRESCKVENHIKLKESCTLYCNAANKLNNIEHQDNTILNHKCRLTFWYSHLKGNEGKQEYSANTTKVGNTCLFLCRGHM
jgi:hypothetical protein